ncbi:4-hydroxy-tetrahydrodipicolinate synthase [Candidatus Saccharibacteria bacterium]|nr:4-hydroxy-tetrahydrodipicolinate synthase [Candidatus Saccharibacteria bacterium]
MSKDIDKYQVWTAIVTPMNQDGSIDYASFEGLLKKQNEVGNAITILGSTGEALNIDLSERKEILDFAISLSLGVPLMVGVGGINLNEQSQWIEYLNKLNADAYLLVVPLYAKPGVYGQYGWFKHLLDLANKPCMLYNVPGRTAKNLEIETVKMLVDHPNFWAVKEASGSEKDFAAYAAAAPGKKMMSGDDLLLPEFAKLGAEGVVSVASNVWPEATKEYAAQCINGTFKDKEIWAESIEALFSSSNPIPAKALLKEQGKIKSSTLRLPLSIEDMGDVEIVKNADKKINEWFNQQSD